MSRGILTLLQFGEVEAVALSKDASGIKKDGRELTPLLPGERVRRVGVEEDAKQPGEVVDSLLVMYCPQCKAEYRQGFTHCADCEVDLVEELPNGSQPTKPRPPWNDDRMSPEMLPDWDEMRSVWEGDDAVECAGVCRQLQQEEIQYRVDQSILSREARMGVQWKYQVRVGAADYEKARKAQGYEEDEGKELPDEAENEAATELPARDDLPVEDVHGDWNPRGWYPEDATLEVWSGNPIERGSVVEMSLKENRINYRVAMESDELKRVFVVPEDEARAREIVREIVEGDPPE